jgi:hypothetical protein
MIKKPRRTYVRSSRTSRNVCVGINEKLLNETPEEPGMKSSYKEYALGENIFVRKLGKGTICTKRKIKKATKRYLGHFKEEVRDTLFCGFSFIRK